jgi:glycosyl transferase family 2
VTPEQVAAHKRRIADLSKAFPYTRQANIALIVLSFNHRSRIPRLLDRMRLTSAQEVIVCEDGSWDGSLEEWDRRLVRRNDFLLRSNDLHEIRAYDRAIHLASAPIVCLLQDDDLLPEDGAWVHEALALFDAIPTLAIVSGYYGLLGELYGNLEPEGPCVIPYLSPVTGRPFMYIAEAYVGPFFIRKSFYEAAGGFDHAYSEPGECGILFEAALCYRAWVTGWRVGLVDCFVKGDAGAGVTPGTWWSEGARTEAQMRNDARLDASYRRTVGDEVSARARTFNDATLVPAPVTDPAVAMIRARSSRGDILQAGAVLHRGRVILLLGESRRQTIDLVEALVRHGATLISTDTVSLGPQGHIQIPPSPIGLTSGVPTDLDISLIAAMQDGAAAHSAPTALAGARAALLILSRIAPPGGTGGQLRRRMQLAARLASQATTLSGLRPDADASAPLVLAYLDRVIEGGAREVPAE